MTIKKNKYYSFKNAYKNKAMRFKVNNNENFHKKYVCKIIF